MKIDDVTLERTATPPRRSRRPRPALLIGASLAVLVVLVVVAQLLLPVIATDRLTSSLERNGTDVHVSVSAFPAIELLWGDADTVNVRIAKLVSGSHHVGNLLARTESVGTLTARVATLDDHGLVLQNVMLTKRGGTVSAQATVTRQAVQAILPLNMQLADAPLGSSGLIVHASVSVLGKSIGISADVTADDGRIILRPALGGLAQALNVFHVTIFDNPAVAVDRVWATSHGDSYTLGASGHYR